MESVFLLSGKYTMIPTNQVSNLDTASDIRHALSVPLHVRSFEAIKPRLQSCLAFNVRSFAVKKLIASGHSGLTSKFNQKSNKFQPKP